MSKTTKQHFEDCKQISTVLDNANVLLTKATHELFRTRECLEALIKYQHPEMRMKVPHGLKQHNPSGEVSPDELIRNQVKQINEILGDRA